MESNVLIVDDDKDIRNLISVYLENEGLHTQKAKGAIEALSLLEQKEFDLMILDIMMPNMDGIEACMKIRQERNLPIIMLSAKSEDMDKIQGLAAGADDYLSKPFNPLELIARVKFQLRRYKKYNTDTRSTKNIIEIGDLTVNTDTRQVWMRGREVRLTPKKLNLILNIQFLHDLFHRHACQSHFYSLLFNFNRITHSCPHRKNTSKSNFG